jgi:hypothetical protein
VGTIGVLRMNLGSIRGKSVEEGLTFDAVCEHCGKGFDLELELGRSEIREVARPQPLA